MLMLMQAARASPIQGLLIKSANLRVGLVEGSATNARAAIHQGKTCCSPPMHMLPKECCVLKNCSYDLHLKLYQHVYFKVLASLQNMHCCLSCPACALSMLSNGKLAHIPGCNMLQRLQQSMQTCQKGKRHRL